MERENMHQNVSEQKEAMSMAHVRAIIKTIRKERTTPPTTSLNVQEKECTEKTNKKKRKKPELSDGLIQFQQIKRQRKDEREKKKKENKAKDVDITEKPSSVTPQKRAMTFRLYPSNDLKQILFRWFRALQALENLTRQIITDHKTNNQQLHSQYIRDKLIIFTDKHIDDTTLPYYHIRRQFTTLPYDLQTACFKRVWGNHTSLEKNMKAGNIKSGSLSEKVNKEGHDWHVLDLDSSLMTSNIKTGEVTICPKLLEGYDTRLFIKDRLISWLGKTCKWGNVLAAGKRQGGKGFKIMYQKSSRRWYLTLTYDKLTTKAGPFRNEIIQEILDTPTDCRTHAKHWIKLQTQLQVKTGNSCGVDPGAKCPIAVYDVHRQQVFKFCQSDLQEANEKIFDKIGKIQSFNANKPKNQSKANRRRRRKLKKRTQGKKRGRLKQQIKKEKRISYRKTAGYKSRRRQKDTTKLLCKINGRKVLDSMRLGLLQKLYGKVTARVKQVHGAIANYMIREYDMIVLPEFMTRQMISRRRKKLRLPDIQTPPPPRMFELAKKTKRALQSFSHYKFRQRLLSKALGTPTKDVNITTEEFGTKQCCDCGYVNNIRLGQEVFDCDLCLLRADRDGKGAFCTILRAITKEEIQLDL